RSGHQHVAPPAQDGVDRVLREVDPLRIEDPVLDVRQTESCGAPAGDLDHRGAEVTRDETAALADESRSLEADVALPGCELEHDVARFWSELSDEPPGHRCGHLLA